MDSSNKSIARRINKELKIRGWKQKELLRRIIRYKNPGFSDGEIYLEELAKKGNFSTALKGNSNRAIPKEDLYIISKEFGLPLEYIWFGDEKKSGFVPKGIRYTAYQDSDDEYRNFIGGLEFEYKINNTDEFGFNLFDYFGQYESINGYRYFTKNFNLHFDYVQSRQLCIIDSEGNTEYTSYSYEEDQYSYGLLETLVKYKDVKTFKAIYFDNCSDTRFNPSMYSHNNKRLFNDDFLETLLNNDDFLDLVLNTKTVYLNSFAKRYGKEEKRSFIEPMFYEALMYAADHESEYSAQLEKMLRFALRYNKEQYEFIKEYLRKNSESEYGDVQIEVYSPRFLRSSRYIPMGNVVRVVKTSNNKVINDLIGEIEQYAFNMTHIINEQEKSHGEIKISTPNNPLFLELHNNAIEQKADFIPFMSHSNKEFTLFSYYDSMNIHTTNLDELKFVLNILDESQKLVQKKDGKVLVHGNLGGKVLMMTQEKLIGLAEWQKCHYGDKYEDRAVLLSNYDSYYSYDGKYLDEYQKIFDVISQGFDKEEQATLLKRAIEILEKKKEDALKNEDDEKHLIKACRFKEQASKLELFKEIHLSK